VPIIDYYGLSIYGYQGSDNKDYISSDGIKFNGGGTPAVRRCVAFSPEWDGLLSVTFRSGNNSTRTLHIAQAGESIVDIQTASTATEPVTVSVALSSDELYYIWIDGGAGIISEMHYV